MDGKLLDLVLDIEPLGFPFDYFITKVIRDIYTLSFLCLSWRPAPLLHLRRICWAAVSNEKKTKEFEMGLDAQKSFA